MTIRQIEAPVGTWPLDDAACSDWEAMAPVTGRAATSAVSLLWRMTGRRYGTREITIRPCRTDDASHLRSSWNNGLIRIDGALAAPVVVDGTPTFGETYACSTCSTPSRAALTLPYPVTAITDVTIDGVSQDLANFVVVDGNRIIWQHPDGTLFPTTQDLTAPLGDPNTWSITLTTGTPPPADAASITGLFACEIAKAMSDLPCSLPRNVVSVVRQGITLQLADPSFIRNGLTGITDVDLFIRSVNPYGLAERATFTSPDTIARTPAQTTWQGA